MTSGDRNKRKRNPKRISSLQERLVREKAAFEQLKRKPNKTPADNVELKRREQAVEHLQKKIKQKSEPHSRRGERH
jgi:small-conductance mechanosensitive channel